jgi:nickel-dependent lactate racemase
MKLPYGNTEVSLDLTGFLKAKSFSPPEIDSPVVPGPSVRESLHRPVGCPALRDMASQARRVVVCIPDRTRPPVAREILPVVIDELLQAGLTADRIAIFVATGTHARHSQENLEELAGEAGGGLEIRQNEAYKIETFETLGTTGRRTPVLVNRNVVDADLKIVIGTIAYHYFAGWGGGRKMLIPGAAHFETACANHRLTIDEKGNLHPQCRNGVLSGNPVHEDMIEAAGYVKNVFLINILLDGWARVAGFVSGDLLESYYSAVERARGLLEVPVGQRCDLAIASAGGFPYDINFVQAHKTIDHAAESVKDGGVAVVLAECADGLGSDNLITWFELGDAEAVSKRLLWQYQIHGHTALALMKKLERIKIVLVSSLPRETVEKMGMIPARDVKDALSTAESLLRGDGLTYVFPCAWGILPVA